VAIVIKKTAMYQFFVFFIFFSLFNIAPCEAQKKTMTVEQVVQANLDCYNKRDIEGFMSFFSPDIQFYNFADNKMTIDGLAQCRKVYQELFDLSPKLHSTILKRIVLDNKVIDHESIVGRRGADEVVELILIYEVKDHKIYRVTVIRK
jgi:hypothetical protein